MSGKNKKSNDRGTPVSPAVSAVAKAVGGEINLKDENLPYFEISWDDLEGLRSQSAEGLARIAMSTSELMKSAFISPVLEQLTDKEKAEIAVIAQGFERDVKNYESTLRKISERHTGKTGKVKDHEEMETAVLLGDQYMQFSGAMIATTAPITTRLAELVGGACERIPLDQKNDSTATTEEQTNVN